VVADHLERLVDRDLGVAALEVAIGDFSDVGVRHRDARVLAERREHAHRVGCPLADHEAAVVYIPIPAPPASR